MIRNLLATTAIATLLATGAYAQADDPRQRRRANTVGDCRRAAAPADGYLASNIIGENVYNGTGDNAEKIGDVNDLVLDGKGLTTVVVGVGGFLGVGEKNVAVDFDKLDWAQKNGDRWLVVAATKEELEGLPTFDRRPYDPAPAAMSTSSTDGTGMAPATTDTTQPAAPATGTGTTAQ